VRTKVFIVLAQVGGESFMFGSVKTPRRPRERLYRFAQFIRAPSQPVMFFGDGFLGIHCHARGETVTLVARVPVARRAVL
jgi:hypothetical protein